MHRIATRALVTLASAVTVALTAVDARAAAPQPLADLSPSHMECGPVVPDTATRPGDDILCLLSVDVLTGFGYDATADITIPAGTSYDPNAARNYQGTLDPAHPGIVHYDTKQLGLLTAAQPKTVQMQLHIDDDGVLKPGDPIAPVATVHASNAPDWVTAASGGVVMPPAAVLDPSTMTCDDDNGAPLRPDDQLVCVVDLANRPLTEDALGPSAEVPITPGVTWAPGGNESFHTVSSGVWLPGTLRDVVSGAPAITAMTFRLAVADNTMPGTFVRPSALIRYENALSHTPGQYLVIGPSFQTVPGPAVLTASTLTCADADGPPLYAGDTLNCTLRLADAVGRESVDDVTARAAVPAGTTSPQGTGDAVVFTGSALGPVAPGTSRSVAYQLRVDSATAPGTAVAPTAEITARSVGTDLPVGAKLAAPVFVVAMRPAAPAGSAPVAGAAVVPAKPSAHGAPAKPASRICTSRRVVVVNVRPPRGRHWKAVTMRFAKKAVGARKAPGTKGRKGYFRARLVFQGLPKGPLTVSISGTTTAGKVVRSSRTYNLCTKKRG